LRIHFRNHLIQDTHALRAVEAFITVSQMTLLNEEAQGIIYSLYRFSLPPLFKPLSHRVRTACDGY
jgi:hypothetical protein